jgi:hypothetical protein
MINTPIKALMLLFLGGALVEDAALWALSWWQPDLWFHVFHRADPLGFDVALLRRAGGQWAAFALVQAIALLRWRTQPLWLVIVAGARLSDLFTDVSYIAAVPSLTPLGWAALVPPAFLNLAFAATMMVAWRQLCKSREGVGRVA